MFIDVIIACFFVFVWYTFFIYKIAYKRGQVHALSSTKVMYTLEKRDDGSSYWKSTNGINRAIHCNNYCSLRPPVLYKRIVVKCVEEN